ncbi:MAG TPA: DNA recombination protein RmuC [Microbacteriaceae bacterium]|nr:DNA recombination protein RmuC [Microbacteriaceae bacterium]
MEAWLVVIGAIVGLVVGGAVAWVLASRAAASRARAEIASAAASAAAERDNALALIASQHETALAQERALAAQTAARVQAELAAAQASIEALEGQVLAAATQYKDLIDRGERDAAAQKAREAAESKVLQALTPVQETLRTMQSKVTELEQQRAQQHGELAQQLKAATEGEERLRATAEALAAALRNNAVRGAWGETQLRTLVESAGLLQHVDFTEQATISVDDTSRRPDMVVHLPGGKQMAIDAKVPYNDFIEATAIPPSATGDDEARRRSLIAAHAKRVRGHVDALAGRGYWNGLEVSPDFVIAFIPNEALLSAANEGDAGLMDYALSKSVVLASPVSLWAVLKTVAFTWRQDVLTEDAKRLFDLSRELYTRLTTLAEHAEKLRRSIDATVTNYNTFASSLESRVLVTARKLDDLDESKVIAEPKLIETRPKQLTAPELAEAVEVELIEDFELDAPS